MKKTYKIYNVDNLTIEPEVNLEKYGYGITEIYPTILRALYIDSYDVSDTFDTLKEAETYLENNLLSEYGNPYTILTEYNY